MVYLRVFAREMAYVAPVGYVENGKEYKKRLIRGMMMEENATGRPQMRISNTLPYNGRTYGRMFTIRCSRTVSIRPGMLCTNVPTNERLAAKRITNTDRCTRCDRLDTLTHKIIACQE
jgi:hypothetical protein